MNRGLKRISQSSMDGLASGAVAGVSPMNRGLKLIFFLHPIVVFRRVAGVSPMNRGLKPNRKR